MADIIIVVLSLAKRTFLLNLEILLMENFNHIHSLYLLVRFVEGSKSPVELEILLHSLNFSSHKGFCSRHNVFQTMDRMMMHLACPLYKKNQQYIF